MFSSVVRMYDEIMAKADPRHADWPLMSSPLPTLALCLIYVSTVTKIGPKWMKNRKPFDLKLFMILYNFLMVIVFAYMFYSLSVDAWFNDYSWLCQPVDYSMSPRAMNILTMSYLYYITRLLVFTDTLTFVLRKKNHQITAAHVIHHGLMPFTVWWGVKFVPGGHTTFTAYVHSVVSIFMYTYFGLATLGPNMSKFLWWKKYLTTLQIIQFTVIFIHSIQVLIWSDCGFPKVFELWICANILICCFLFIAFNVNAYNSRWSNLFAAVKTIANACHPQDFNTGNLMDVNENSLNKDK